MSIRVCKHKLNCNLCGKDGIVLSIYLEDKSRNKPIDGFYSDCHIYLCKQCIKNLLKIFPKKEAQNAKINE